MKKVFSFLAVLAVTVFMASSAWAAFTSSAKEAYATFTAQELTFDVNLYHWTGTSYSTDTPATSINFEASEVALGTTTASVVISSDFAKISSNLNIQKAGTKVYMYTQSTTTAMGNFQALFGKTEGTTVGNSTTTYGGLIRKGQSGAYVEGDLAPIQIKCLSVSSTTLTSLTTPKNLTFNDSDMYDGDRYVADTANTYCGTELKDMTYYDDYTIIGKSGADGGIWLGGHWADHDSWFSKGEDVVMFFKAVFSNVSAGDEFGTKTITFSIYRE